MNSLSLNQMENVQGGIPFSCITGVAGMIALGIAVTTTTAGLGSLAWGGMMLSAFTSGGSLGHCLYSVNSAA